MFSEILRQEWRLLTFREARIDLVNYKYGFLFFAVLATWIAGIGRYWDHPDAHPVLLILYILACVRAWKQSNSLMRDARRVGAA